MKLWRADTASNFSLRNSTMVRLGVFGSVEDAVTYAENLGVTGYTVAPTNDLTD